MHPFMTVLLFALLSFALAGCGKSQAEKETNDHLSVPSPSKDRHASK